VSISIEKPNDNTLKINVDTALGNDVHRDFREAYTNNPAQKYIIDLRNSQTIDSSGLGMLLLFKDFAGGENANIEIINCSEHVLDIFHVTCFFRLFSIPQYNPKKAANG